MKKQSLTFTLSHAKEKDGTPLQPIAATVPGAVQLDYAKALDYAPYYFGVNFRQFDWMEDEYFFYDTSFEFTLNEGETAQLCFDSIDYRYEISIDGDVIFEGEGIFTPIKTAKSGSVPVTSDSLTLTDTLFSQAESRESSSLQATTFTLQQLKKRSTSLTT